MPRTSMKQAIAQPTLQRPYMKANRRLSQSKFRRCFGKIQMPGCGFKRAKPCEVDVFSQHDLSPNLFAYRLHIYSFLFSTQVMNIEVNKANIYLRENPHAPILIE